MKDWTFKKADDFGLTPEERLKSLRREATLVEFFAGSIWRLAARAYFKAIHRIRVIGAENIPTDVPFVIIANHASHLDAVCIGAVLPGAIASKVYPVAADDVFFRNRTRSIFTALTVNALPITRKSPKKGVAEIVRLRERLLERTCGYILFPEGTRTRNGEMNEFKRGIGMLVAGTEVPVVPCYLQGFFEACPPERALPRAVPLTATFGAPRIFTDRENTSDGWASIAEELEAVIREMSA